MEAPAAFDLDWHFENVSREHDFESLTVEGEIPAHLRGLLVRNGPGIFDIGETSVGHWFDGRMVGT